MNINLSNEFSQIMSFIVNVFKSVIGWLDGIIIIGNSTSLLDINIAFTVFSIILVAVFNVVQSGAVNSMDTVTESRKAQDRSEKEEARYNKRRDENRKYSEAREMHREFVRSQRGK